MPSFAAQVCGKTTAIAEVSSRALHYRDAKHSRAKLGGVPTRLAQALLLMKATWRPTWCVVRRITEKLGTLLSVFYTRTCSEVSVAVWPI